MFRWYWAKSIGQRFSIKNQKLQQNFRWQSSLIKKNPIISIHTAKAKTVHFQGQFLDIFFKERLFHETDFTGNFLHYTSFRFTAIKVCGNSWIYRRSVHNNDISELCDHNCSSAVLQGSSLKNIEWKVKANKHRKDIK